MAVNFTEIEGNFDGNIGKGQGSITFLLSSQKITKDENGENVKIPCFYQVCCFGELADTMAKYEGVAGHLSVRGKLEMQSFSDGENIVKLPAIRAVSVRATQPLSEDALDTNVVIMVGRVATDISYDEKSKVAKFNVAHTTFKKVNGTEKPNPETAFFKCVAFQDTAATIHKLVEKGSLMTVLGRLDHSQWMDKENKIKNSISIIVDQFEFSKANTKQAEQQQPVIAGMMPSLMPVPSMQ